ncbi:MAG: alpha/beta hydrolase [Legionella sp.]|nr:MAG: alpha/beta hydrolase [Legionella sp.]
MLKQILTMGAVIFVFVVVLMYVFQRHLIYFPDRHHPHLEQFSAQDMQVITLKTKDKISLNSWYKPALSKHPTILYLHGNAGHIGYRVPLVRQFMDAGLGVFLLEYRGYGGNKGSPSEQGFYEDGRAAMAFLNNQGISSKHIILFGESLGSGVATYLATQYPICAVVLHSPFSSLTRVAQFHYPWIPLTPWDKYDSLSRIQLIKAPILITHGTKDRIVPYEEGLTLYQAANQPKKLLRVKDKDHNDLWKSDHYSQKVIDFIEQYCH